MKAGTNRKIKMVMQQKAADGKDGQKEDDVERESKKDIDKADENKQQAKTKKGGEKVSEWSCRQLSPL